MDSRDAKFERVAQVALADANAKRENAGYSGCHDDGGASTIQALVEAWQYGLRGKVPPSLRSYAELAEVQADPEWAEYVRLRTKFNHR